MPRRRVLLIGWDAADWKVIHRLVDAGHMPHLARLLERGVMGNIATLQRVHPHELEGDMLRAFVPQAAEIDQHKDERLGVLARLVAEMASVQAAATHALHARPDWDFCAIYQDAIDHFSHAFMRYHPPRLPWVSEDDFALYSQVLGGAYVFHDTMLGALLALAGDDVTVILVSDHGFHPDQMRVRSLPNEPAGPAAEHRPLGIFVAAGPGIRRDGLVSGATLLDICPTVLSLYGLPVGRDMDGRPLLEIYEQPPAVGLIDSWDERPGDAALLEGVDEGGSEAAAGEDLAAEIDVEKLSDEHRQQLRALRGRATANPRTFAFLEAKLLGGERRWEEALARLETIDRVEPSRRPALLLERANALMALKRHAEAAAAFRDVLEIDPLYAMAHFGLARAAYNAGDNATAVSEARIATGCRPHFPAAHLLAGLALWRTGDTAAAEQHLRGAVTQAPENAVAQRVLAAFLGRVKRDFAEAALHQRLAREARRAVRQRRETAGTVPQSRRPAAAVAGEPESAEPPAAFSATLPECVIVVTGLPRSGTSMAMQMLAAGGVAVLADDKRLADESNPRGYVEFEPVKRIVQDASWVEAARGRAVKIVAPLVHHLPRGEGAPPYLVIAMRRSVAEVVASQQAMLTRIGRQGSGLGNDALTEILERQATATRTFLGHLASRGRARVFDMPYRDAVADPAAIARRLAAFLGDSERFSFDVAGAAAAVDASLHRVRGSCLVEAVETDGPTVTRLAAKLQRVVHQRPQEQWAGH